MCLYYLQLRLGFVSTFLIPDEDCTHSFFFSPLPLPFPLPVSFLLPLPVPLTNFGRPEFSVSQGRRKSVNSISGNGQEEKNGLVDKEEFLDILLFFGRV